MQKVCCFLLFTSYLVKIYIDLNNYATNEKTANAFILFPSKKFKTA